ncbi:MAG: sigma-70 family RNA polymerase sigma factor [Gemmataceae bacterium]|nr:sigma-70 family RNA polymerase sigma factor [Gemmataceae bacterium]
MRPIFDANWRTRALGGDSDAVKTLAESALQPLYAFCLYRVGRNQALCEEVVQETLVRAIRELDRYDPSRAGDNIFPWLTGLARNEISRVLSREKHAVSLESLWARMDKDLLTLYAKLELEPFGDEVLQREETRELVNTTMSQLPPHYREALEAKYVGGKSVRDIAGLGNISEKAVESLLTRARQAFRVTFLSLSHNLEAELS